jgi:hypothetical protein
MADGTQDPAHPPAPTEYRAPALLFTRRLGFRLCLLVLVAVAPIFAIAAQAALDARDDAVRSSGSQAERLADIAAYTQQATIDQAQKVLEAAAASPSLSRGTPEERTAYLKDLLIRNPAYLDFHVVGRDGAIVAGALSSAAESAATCNRLIVDRVLKTGLPAVGDFEKDPKGPPTVYLARPAGEGLVVAARLTMGWLLQFHATLRLPEGSVLDVLDVKGLNMVRLPRSSVGDTGQIHPAPQLLAVRSDDLPVKGEDTDGVVRYFGVAPLLTEGANKGFRVVVGIPETAVTGPAARALTLQLVLSAIVLVISLVLAQILAEQFVLKRVNGLILATRRLASTDLANLKARQRVCQDPSELGDLERSFDDMARALERRARELEARAREN